MVCFLALALESALMRSMKSACKGDISLMDLMADLNRLQAIRVSIDGREYLLRTELHGMAYEVFEALGLRPPEKFQLLSQKKDSISAQRLGKVKRFRRSVVVRLFAYPRKWAFPWLSQKLDVKDESKMRKTERRSKLACRPFRVRIFKSQKK